MRYITQQQHKKSCGPVAIMNALKWLGEKVSYREDLELFEQIGYKRNDGWWRHELRRGLHYFNIKHKLYKKPTIKDMKDILKRGNAIIMSYDWITESSNGGHYIFIDRHMLGCFKGYNITSSKEEDGIITERYMKQALWASNHLRKNNIKGRRGVEIWEIYDQA